MRPDPAAAARSLAGLLAALAAAATAFAAGPAEPVLARSRYALVLGSPRARGLAPRVGELVDEAAPRVARLVGARDLAPVPTVIYADRGEFLQATGLPRRSAIVGLATFPPGAIHVDGTGRLVSIEKVVPHEVAHVMVARALGSALGALPRWVNEGIAEYAAGEQASQVDPETLRAVGRGEFLPLSHLDDALQGGGRPQSLAYAEAASVVHFLVAEKGEGVIAELLRAVREEGDAARAVNQISGWSEAELQAAWRRSVARRWRWPLLLQSPVLPFGLMVLIFIVGYLRYRRERKRRQEQPESDW